MSAGHIAQSVTGTGLAGIGFKPVPREEFSGLGAMSGASPVMERLFTQMRTTAPHLRVAAIEGPSGAGKALAARTLHNAGPASAGRFVPTRATTFFADSQALLAEAAGGTLFLSHIDELDRSQQARLADFMEWLEHMHTRKVEYVPRQLFASSRMPLRRLAGEGGLRPELSHRLSAICFVLPPLVERRQDISLLAERFIEDFSQRHGKPVRGLGPGALPRLQAHTWPGNVRELESVIHAAALSCEGQWIRPIDIPALNASVSFPSGREDADNGRWSTDAKAGAGAVAQSLEEEANLDRAILRHVQAVLTAVKGNKLRAAQLLGISRSTLYRLLEARSFSEKL
ncbi:MAG: sigma-54-dependent Fis family transcriptional regulator [Acidobacteria bacterium]|nr:sigma-54-dependent Fis family transcriptional regulator [Acidobacteriota bacterium]MBW4044831.1 sigma-54-dependent Fis family transcriptional regulator [Acidobacteriota bacterium]